MTITFYNNTAPYHDKPLDIYNGMADKTNTILLESAEIKTKQDTYSLMVPKTCVRIVAGKDTVTLTALNANGQNCIQHMVGVLAQFQATLNGDTLTCTFPATDNNLEEQERVKTPNVLHVLRLLRHEYQSAGDAFFLTGVFSFDLLEISENIGQVPMGENDCPNYVFYIAEILMRFDHAQKTVTTSGIVFHGHNGQNSNTSDITTSVQSQLNDLKSYGIAPLMVDDVAITKSIAPTTSTSDTEFCSQVKKCKDYICAGDAFQIVPSRVFSLPCEKPLLSYAALKQLNPSPYMFYMNDEDFITFGASPESALKYESATNEVTLYPIAGTRPRGKNPDGSINIDLDSRHELDLRTDKKETSEHIMLVDLARNDIARISIPTTRTVASLMQIDKYSHVQHLVSIVTGQLKPIYDCLHAYQLCMNMGTLTGAPKIRATEIIREMEGKRRGSYGGAVGYINGHGDMDTCITIRSAYVKNNTAYIAAGAGVVLESDPQAEADETRIKAMPVLTAIGKVHGFAIAKESN